MKTVLLILVIVSSVFAVTFPEDDSSRPHVKGIFGESARVFMNWNAQNFIDEIIGGPGLIINRFSSYEYDPQTFVRYEFAYLDEGTETEHLLEGELDVAYYQVPNTYGELAVFFENFQPVVNRTRCDKAFPYRPSDLRSANDLHKDTRQFLVDSYGRVNHLPNNNPNHPFNRGCDYLPITIALARKGNGAMLEERLVAKEGKTDVDIAEYLTSLGAPIRWRVIGYLPGFIFGFSEDSPFVNAKGEILLVDVQFFETGARVYEVQIFNPFILWLLSQAASSQERNINNINFEILTEVMADVISAADAYKLRYPEYVAGIDLLVANA
jgi:hypothetical protein